MIALPQNSIDPAAHELVRRVALFLQQKQATFGGRVVIEAHRGVVTLAGEVPSFYQRQLILAFARRVAGVVQVIDQLKVTPTAEVRGQPREVKRQQSEVKAPLVLST